MAGARRPGRSGARLRRACTSLVTAGCIVLAACGPHQDTSAIELRWTLTPPPSDVAVGPLRVELDVLEAGTPLIDADVRIHGVMTHPGMVPVIASATETTPGRYEAQIDLTMAGDWILLAEGTLADGRPLTGERSLPGVSPP